jgi:hypothetical protein
MADKISFDLHNANIKKYSFLMLRVTWTYGQNSTVCQVFREILFHWKYGDLTMVCNIFIFTILQKYNTFGTYACTFLNWKTRKFCSPFLRAFRIWRVRPSASPPIRPSALLAYHISHACHTAPAFPLPHERPIFINDYSREVLWIVYVFIRWHCSSRL